MLSILPGEPCSCSLPENEHSQPEPGPGHKGRSLFPSLRHMAHAALFKTLEAAVNAPAPARMVVVDGTCGNGHDTAFLAGALASLGTEKRCRILSFDIQQAALDRAAFLLEKKAPGAPVSFLLQGHEELGRCLADCAAPGEFVAAVYNLGFLPRSDRRVTTKKESTLRSLEAAARHLACRGLLAVHAYGGHAGGAEELQAVEAWFAALPCEHWQVVSYAVCNKPKNPEVLFLAERTSPPEADEQTLAPWGAPLRRSEKE